MLFWIDTNDAFGETKSLAQWESHIASVMAGGNRCSRSEARGFLLRTKRRETSDHLTFGFGPNCTGETLEDYAKKEGWEL